MAIKIITDSTCDLDLSLQKELNIDILPLTVHFGDEEFHDGIDITKKEFYDKLRESETSPTTSQVTPAAFEKLFVKYSEEGHNIIVITLASKLSGTYQSAHIAKTTLENEDINLIDSETTTAGLAWLIYEAVSLRDKGASVEEIVQHIENAKKKIVVYAMIENLEYLKKGGRLSVVGATIGTLLNLKPIIQIRHGVVNIVHKTRGTNKAYKWMLNQFREDNIDTSQTIFFGHTDAPDKLSAFIEAAIKKEKTIIQESVEIGITVGTHGGPGCIGIGFITK